MKAYNAHPHNPSRLPTEVGTLPALSRFSAPSILQFTFHLSESGSNASSMSVSRSEHEDWVKYRIGTSFVTPKGACGYGGVRSLGPPLLLYPKRVGVVHCFRR
jgi:hypothetical protein